MSTLSNKNVFITGASSGIGEAAALAFAKAGANLIICARRLDRLEKLARYCEQTFHQKVYYFKADISHKNDISENLDKLNQFVSLENIDILINNAGLAKGQSSFQDAIIEDWEEMINTNIKGMLYTTRLILPYMVKKNQGHIINIGSIAGREAYPGGAVYCATKHALHALSQALRMDLSGTNIRVSLISPGLVETEFSKVRFKGDNIRAQLPYQGITPLNAHDIAEAILYCAAAPPHVNISEIFLTPTAQASATQVYRHTK